VNTSPRRETAGGFSSTQALFKAKRGGSKAAAFSPVLSLGDRWSLEAGLARELVTQELGILALIKRGVRVLTANGDNLTE
jgi:hypothetical protein